MSTAEVTNDNAEGSTALVPSIEYAISEKDIADAKEKYAGLTADTKEGYEEVRLALGQLRTTRTAIEKRRKQLKAGALEYGRRVDAAANKLTALIEEIEEPLRLKKEVIDKAEEVARRAAEDAERVAAEAEAARMREAEEARIVLERTKLEVQRREFEETQRKADEEARVERDRIAAERRAYEETQRIERERVDAEQKAAQAVIDAQRAELEEQQRAIREREEAAARVEQQRLDAIRKEQEAKEQAERDRIAAEQKAAEDAKQAAAEAARLEALRPDIEKINTWAGTIRALAEHAPTLLSVEGAAGIKWSIARLFNIAEKLEGFEKKKEVA